MNTAAASAFTQQFITDLRTYQALCEEVLDLASRESCALDGEAYDSSSFTARRKDLLPRLDTALTMLRHRRQEWQSLGLDHGEFSSEVKNLFQAVQDLIMKILI